MLPSFSKIETERTKVLAKNAGKAPDIVIIATGRSPVIIEAEYLPANNVEAVAKERLKSRLKNQTLPLESVIALIYPHELRQTTNLKTSLAKIACAIVFFTPTKIPSPNTAGWKFLPTICRSHPLNRHPSKRL